MLIAQIPALLSKIVQLRFQQHGHQASRALACHGIIGQDYQIISESGFNQLISSIDRSRIIHLDDSTLICDARDRVHALIKAPYFDARGQSHAVRYFALKNAKLSPFSRFKNHSQEAIKNIFKSSAAMLKTRPKRRLKATVDTSQTVWTTVRLTT
ncbi:MAG: hypothetical protein VX231_09525 [Pseudomonadota bacterium]|nr:hypothetical protein [Pseudomonadota bacterium]